jgi:riboflavin synthase
MFTGLVETVGKVRRVVGNAPLRLEIECSLRGEPLAVGESVCVDGCCLTVVEAGPNFAVFEAGAETLSRTTIGELRSGARVNLERSLKVGERLSGHFVLGHVDGVGTIAEIARQGATVYWWVRASEDVANLCVERGSIALSGVSLTITGTRGREFSVALIPHTLNATTLGECRIGSRVNLEADIIARLIASRLVSSRASAEVLPRLTEQFLKDNGFL